MNINIFETNLLKLKRFNALLDEKPNTQFFFNVRIFLKLINLKILYNVVGFFLKSRLEAHE